MQTTPVKVKHVQGTPVSQQAAKNTLLISHLTNADHVSALQNVYTVDELYQCADNGFTNPFANYSLVSRKEAIV